jgi:hypothetical protein
MTNSVKFANEYYNIRVKEAEIITFDELNFRQIRSGKKADYLGDPGGHLDHPNNHFIPSHVKHSTNVRMSMKFLSTSSNILMTLK